MLFAFALFFIIEFYNIIFRGFAPLISTRQEVINHILTELKLNHGDRVFELGAGDAGFLRHAEKKFPDSDFTGVEYSFWPWLTTKLQLALKKSKINLERKNLFKVALADADLIYCYLNIKMMEALKDKFKQECKAGTKIISLQFPIRDWQPEKVISTENSGKIYFYTI
jgi:16S rRNA A1518/A1519 N6-dimethyltransferase RsmA/KsgA/DIM1 with predicted DNA glycosylase/AP lyase activity